MYRQTTRSREQIARMIAARDQRRIERPAPDYPAALPDLRRRIVVEDFDFGHRVHVIELHRTGRVDQYRAVVDGVVWKRRIGWSGVLAGLRKALPRVMSPRRVAG